MANWTNLKTAIANAIKTNGNQEITGAILQNTLNSIVSGVGENATFAGIATPTTNPGTPDGPVFYIATTAGIYSNFGSIKVIEGEAAILQWNNNTWTKKTTGLATQNNIAELEQGGIYDISAHNGGVAFESLSALLSSSNLNTLIPTSVRHGGMTIRFVRSSDNKYVQYRLMSDTFNTTVTNWQGVDDEPTAGSDNLVKSRGVAEYVDNLSINHKFILRGGNLKTEQKIKFAKGNKYRIYFPVTSWDISSVDAGNAVAFIDRYYNGSNVANIFVRRTTNPELPSYFDFTASDNDYYLFGFRGALNTDVFVFIVDITFTTEESQRIEYLINNGITSQSVSRIYYTSSVSNNIKKKCILEAGKRYRISVSQDWDYSNASASNAILVVDKVVGSTHTTVILVRKGFPKEPFYDFTTDVCDYYEVNLYIKANTSAICSIENINALIKINSDIYNLGKDIKTSLSNELNGTSIILNSDCFANGYSVSGSSYSSGSYSCYGGYIPINNDLILSATVGMRVYLYSDTNIGSFIKYVGDFSKTSMVVKFNQSGAKFLKVVFNSSDITWDNLNFTVTEKPSNDWFNNVVRFRLLGIGADGVYKNIHLTKGCRYRIHLPLSWSITSITGSKAIFAIDRYYNGSNAGNIVVVRANNPITKEFYDFTATDNDYYRFLICADENTPVDFEIENITYPAELNNEEIYKKKVFRDLDTEGWVINDGYVYTAFNAPHLNIEPTKGIAYLSGMSSKTDYGEAGGNLILAVYPCVQPYRIEYYTVAKSGDTDVDGNPLSGAPYDMCSMAYYDSNNKYHIRCFFVDFNGYNLYYRDFDTELKEFVSAPVKVQYYNSNNQLEYVTADAMTAFVENQGGVWNGPQKTIFTNHIINNTTLWNDGDYIYSVLTAAGPGNPLVVKSNDNFATIHLVAILPRATADCETAIAKLKGIVYILYRDNNSIFFQTTQDFVNYTTAIEIPNSASQRPEIMVYNNNVYLFVPMRDNTESIIGGRSSYHLLKGTGSDLSNYTTELILHNNFGMVYASAQIFNGRMLMAYSTNMLMLGGRSDGKSTMMFNIIKDYYQP